jgi:hypothetical protein
MVHNNAFSQKKSFFLLVILFDLLLTSCVAGNRYQSTTLIVGPMDYNSNYYTENELLFTLLEFDKETTLGFGTRYRTVTEENQTLGWAMLDEKYSPEVYIYSEDTIDEITSKIKDSYSIIHEYVNPYPGGTGLLSSFINSKLIFNDSKGVTFTFDVYGGEVDYCSCKAVVRMNKIIFSMEEGYFVPDIINFVEFFSNSNDFISWMDTFYNRRLIEGEYLITYLGYDFTINIPNNFDISIYQSLLGSGFDPIKYFDIKIINQN